MLLDLFEGVRFRFGGCGEADDLGDLTPQVVVGALSPYEATTALEQR